MRASLPARLSLLTASCVALPTLLACLEHPLKRVKYEAAQEEMEGIAVTVNKDVDILFVIDDSGSMGEEQLNLSANFGAFVDVLEADDVKANYRLAITTTDAGNVWCSGGGISAPENGQFVLSSCRTRLNEFQFNGQGGAVNAESACTEFCPEEWADIEITPTVIDGDPEAKVRPWIENIEGETNLPEGLTATQAMQCFGPQGVAGCGFESHLESMWKALKNADDRQQTQFGFIRDSAILSVVFVTDEADCSFNRGPMNSIMNEVFGSDGPKTFWSLPDETSPTSAVCWNAGVQCSDNNCMPVNLDPLNNEVSDAQAEDQAALLPVSKYINSLQERENDKKIINPGQEVLVAAIAGVATNYPTTREITYQDGPNPDDPNSFQARFGIAPGCTAIGPSLEDENGDGVVDDNDTTTTAEAVPPVRLKAFADTFLLSDTDNNLFSVCDDDYTPALEAIAEAIRDQLKPACMRACVEDTDPVEPGVQPRCTLTQTYRTDAGETVEDTIPVCGADDAVPDGSDVCFTNLTDQDELTSSTLDDIGPECIEEGWNLEFRLVRSGPAPGGASVSATCQLSQNKIVDCPGLPA